VVYLEKAVSLNPEDPELRYGLASAYALTGDKNKALSNLYSAILYNPRLKDEAKKDEAFKKYWNDAEFKKIVE
jgi:Flp pilus assembly protein TadD